jgi:hypothetical protein
MDEELVETNHSERHVAVLHFQSVGLYLHQSDRWHSSAGSENDRDLGSHPLKIGSCFHHGIPVGYHENAADGYHVG